MFLVKQWTGLSQASNTKVAGEEFIAVGGINNLEKLEWSANDIEKHSSWNKSNDEKWSWLWLAGIKINNDKSWWQKIPR